MKVKNFPIYELGDVLQIVSDYAGDEDTFGEVISIKKKFAESYDDNMFDYVYELSGARPIRLDDRSNMVIPESAKLGKVYPDGGICAIAIYGKVGEVKYTKEFLENKE